MNTMVITMRMKFNDLVKLSIRNLMRRRTRTALTIVGAIIGTTAVVSMFGLSAGLEKSIDVTLSNLGDLTILDIYSTGVYVDDDGQYRLTSNSLSDDIVQMLQYGMDGVLAVCPMMQPENCSFVVHAGKRYQLQYASIVGVNPDVLQFFHFDLSKGELPSDSNDEFIIFGSETLYQFADPNKSAILPSNKDDTTLTLKSYDNQGNRVKPKVDVLSEEIIVHSYLPDDNEQPLKRFHFDKVGVLATNPMDQTNEYLVFMNISSVREMIAEQEKINHVPLRKSELKSYSAIKVRAKNIEAADQITSNLADMGIATYGLSDYRKEMIKSKNSLEVILRFIGIMALFVSTIGISNTTIMSIYERTSEIGVMKVLGCPIQEICKLFLLESAIIGLLGGLLGSFLSVLISVVINHIPNLTIISGIEDGLDISVISPILVIVAVILSTLIGLIAGLIPAQRAIRISALEAIRNVG